MKPLHRLGLATGLLTGLLAPSAAILSLDGPTWIAPALAQPPSEEEKKKRQEGKQPPPRQQPPPQLKQPPPQFKQPPPQMRPPTPPPQQPRANIPPPPPARSNPPPNPAFQQPPKQFGQPPSTPPPQQGKQVVNPQFIPKGPPPPPARQGTPGAPGSPSQPGFMPKTPPTAGPPPGTPPSTGPTTTPGQPRFLPGTPPQGFTKGPGAPQGPAVVMPKRLDDVRGNRQQRIEGNRTVIVEPGNRTIIRQDNRLIIRNDPSERLRFGARDVRSHRAPGGLTETFIVRPNGSRVVTLTDPSGRVLRRYRRDPGGREINIIDNRRFYRNVAIGVGAGLLGAAIILNLPRPVVDIPRDRYIVDYDRASDDDLYEALMAPPLMPLERAYSLDEIRDNYPLRERMRSVDLDNITFDPGSFEVTPDQYRMLERIARVINRVLERRPDEVFLIEGHTDATGAAEDNLSLSDRRAEAVAQVLTETFGVPPENLVTQGYGEQYLKVDTPGPERANRRVTVRAIGPLMGKEMSGRQ
ncbi:MAG: OmpA family protein [Hyphomicrobiaceae bacterium]|nr:OmpA family protein [Hyphomicrobiaceae bacterium]